MVGDGELNTEAIVLELDLEVFLLVDGEGNFDAHLGWGLIPGVLIALGVPQDLVLENILLSQLDDSALIEGGLS